MLHHDRAWLFRNAVTAASASRGYAKRYHRIPKHAFELVARHLVADAITG